MCGLDNPRGLAFSQRRRAAHGSASEAALYVAEAGRGGLGLATSDFFTGAGGGMRSYGPSGAISRLWNGVQARVVTGLPSHSLRGMGGQAIGPHDIALVYRHRHDDWAAATAGSGDCDPGCAYVTIGLRERPGVREASETAFLQNFAKLVRVQPTGAWDYVADLGTYETENDPAQVFYHPDKLDTNPYGLLATPSGRALVVTDAGGNSLLRVRIGRNGKMSKISTLAVFEPHPDDAVPTSVAIGPDGAYYVGELTGFPPVVGMASIYRVGTAVSRLSCALPVSRRSSTSRSTNVETCTFSSTRRDFLTQPNRFLDGTVTRIDRNKSGTRDWDDDGGLCAQYLAGNRTMVVTGLREPTSVAVGPDGAVFISNRGSSAGTGQVVRYEPPAQ